MLATANAENHWCLSSYDTEAQLSFSDLCRYRRHKLIKLSFQNHSVNFNET